jgi:murein DD-endopeptidase MepM/ murein hydrolase activator NlpD
MRISAFSMPSFRFVGLLAAGAAGLALAACGNDVSRFNDNPNGSPYRSQSSDVTYSSGNSGPPVAQIESRPLDQPAYNNGGTPVYGPKVYGQNSTPQPQYQPQQPAYQPQPQYQPQAQPQSNYQPQQNYQQQSYNAPRSVPAAPAPAYSPANDATGSIARQKTTVTLKRGETIRTLAERHGVTVAAILKENNFADASRVRAGTRVVIPARMETAHASPAQGRVMHTVAPQETLSSISRNYHVPRSQIAYANKINEYASLRIGQKLVIPGAAVASNQPARRAETPAQQKVAQLGNQPADNAATVKQIAPVEAETEKPTASSGAPSFRWPVKGRVISNYGSKPNGQQNDGINISVPENTAVKASEDGTVAYAGNELKGYGNLVLVRHAGGFVTAYAHNSEILVHRGETVKRGQVIAKAGQTGGVASPQVHFEIRKGSNPVDPSQYLTSL